MLSIGIVASVAYYVSMAGGYYLDSGEPPGHWWGKSAAALKLAGTVSREALSNLLRGFAPDGKLKLVQNAGGEHRQSGWDLTFNAPKSVSVAMWMTPPSMRALIESAHTRAVHFAMDALEREAAFTRRGKDGLRERVGLVAGIFVHHTSRSLEPHLHSHVVVANACVRPDGTTGTIPQQAALREKAASRSALSSRVRAHS